MASRPAEFSTSRLRWLATSVHAASVLGLVLLLSAAARLVYPAWVGDDVLKELSTGERAEIVRLDAMRGELVELDRRADRLSKQIDAVRKRIAEQSSEGRFLGQLSELAQREQLNIREHRITPPRPFAGRWQMQLTVFGSGRYESICRFLDGITRLPRLCRVDRLDMTTAPDGVYPVELTLAIFFTAAPVNGPGTGDADHG